MAKAQGSYFECVASQYQCPELNTHSMSIDSDCTRYGFLGPFPDAGRLHDHDWHSQIGLWHLQPHSLLQQKQVAQATNVDFSTHAGASIYFLAFPGAPDTPLFRAAYTAPPAWHNVTACCNAVPCQAVHAVVMSGRAERFRICAV